MANREVAYERYNWYLRGYVLARTGRVDTSPAATENILAYSLGIARGIAQREPATMISVSNEIDALMKFSNFESDCVKCAQGTCTAHPEKDSL